MTAAAHTVMESPVGSIRLVATHTALQGLYWPEHRGAPPMPPPAEGPHPVLDLAVAQLREYFRGRRRIFSVPLDPQGTTFQREVWRQLSSIAFGQHETYTSVAAAIGRPAAVRAVASANARNPLSIIVPCHRVIGRDGTLRGYAGGLDAKRWLLEHERTHAPLSTVEASCSR
ncbi:MAG: methylated-DNA--[protein]-cysteine S-methyltransferase [Myxococcota bacterium]